MDGSSCDRIRPSRTHGAAGSSVSDGLKRLAAADLIDHQRYGAIELTPLGRTYAVAMIRRHRLIETFLVETLGYTWDRVHDEAEVLELRSLIS